MEYAEQCRKVAAEVEAVLAAGGIGEYAGVLRARLAADGGTLSDKPPMRWGSMVFQACQSASSGSWEPAVPAAAALELLAAALELFDDLEDEDSSVFETGREKALAMNAACGLLIASQLCAFRLHNCPDVAAKAPKVCGLLLSAGLRIGGGQHLDLTYEGRPDVSPDECLAIASLKSAELVKCAFEVGAALGTDHEHLVSLHAMFGWHLGMFAQVMNDIDGIRSPGLGKSDVARLKATVPIAFWLRGRGDLTNGQRQQDSEAQIRQQIYQSGALHYAWAIADIHRQRAADILSELDKSCSASPVLEHFVQPIEPDFSGPG